MAQWDLDKSLAFYKARFADASHFTFVFVGSFTPEMIKPLVETYVASLPATRAQRDVARPRRRAADRRRREDGREGDRAEEPGGDRLLRPVRLRRRAPAGAAGDDAAAAVAAVRRDPRGARRHLQHHRRAAHGRRCRGPNTRVRIDWTCDPGAHRRRSCSACSTEIEFVRRHAADAGAGGPHPRGAAARTSSRTARTTAICSNQIVRRYEDGDAASVANVFNLPDQIAPADRRGDPAGGAPYLDTDNYVQSDADAGNEVGIHVRSKGKGQRPGKGQESGPTSSQEGNWVFPSFAFDRCPRPLPFALCPLTLLPWRRLESTVRK